MFNSRDVIDFIFSSALFINAILFIPQALKIYQQKSAKDVSIFTFLGFLFIQIAIIAHGIIAKDMLLIYGYLLSVITCGSVVIFSLYYRKYDNIQSSSIPLEKILEQIPAHIYWKDKDGNLLGCNKNNWKDFGFSSINECIGKTDYDFHPKDEADKIRANDDEVRRTGKPKVVEEMHTLVNGKPALYLSHKAPLLDEHNQIVGIIGISVDITNTKQETVKRLETLENIISIMPGHIYWIDRDCRYLGCNDMQAKVAGLKSRQEIVGLRNKDLPWNLKSESLPEDLDRVNMEVMESGRAITLEERAVLEDGTQATFLSNKNFPSSMHNFLEIKYL